MRAGSLVRVGVDPRALVQFPGLVAATVASWTSQGWAIESQTSNSAVLRQDGKVVVVTIDSEGRVATRSIGE